VHAKGDRGDEGGRDADADTGRWRGEGERSGYGARGSTICSASSCIGERVVLVCTRLRLGVPVALHSIRSIAARWHLKKGIKVTGLPRKAQCDE